MNHDRVYLSDKFIIFLKVLDMIQLIFLLLISFLVFMIFKMAKGMKPKKATLEEARSIGLEEASLHINNPILLEDYSVEKDLPIEVLLSLIEEGKMPFYHWHEYTYVENRELATAR